MVRNIAFGATVQARADGFDNHRTFVRSAWASLDRTLSARNWCIGGPVQYNCEMNIPGLHAIAALALLVAPGCATTTLMSQRSDEEPADVVIVPGCPTLEDGSLSLCLKRRALWATQLWERGLTRNFITSGAAVYMPHIEAEALAAAMTRLGVPADRIWLEQNARHTDENMYFSMRIARFLRWPVVAVATDDAQVSGACAFLESWQQPCLRAPLDRSLVEALLVRPEYREALAFRMPPQPEPWLPLAQVERPRVGGRATQRPSSLVLYLVAPLMTLLGDPWTPALPVRETSMTYGKLLRLRGAERR